MLLYKSGASLCDSVTKLQITIPFTLSAYMVRRFEGDQASEQVIGQLTGLLAAAAPFSRFLSSFFWGVTSDYTGRKVGWHFAHILSLRLTSFKQLEYVA